MTSPLARFTTRRLRRRIIKNVLVGKAQKAWDNMPEPQKRLLLTEWCKASTRQIQIALELPWYSLSRWMRMSLKRYFRNHEDPNAVKKGKK